MRPGILLVPFMLLACACGGSSSETPWPVEPEGAALDPAGESSPAGTPVDVPEAPAQEDAEPEDEATPPPRKQPAAPPPEQHR